MPQETKSKFEPGAQGADGTGSLFGWKVDTTDEATAAEALEKAFDYRGDVLLQLVNGSSMTGYIFDRRRGQSLADSYVRLMTAASDEKVKVAFSDIQRVEFSGRDAAHGKSFETWVKKYIEKKTRGEKASIEAEAL
jgi:hypothetical protein